MPSSPTHTRSPQMVECLASVLPRPADKRGIRGQLSPKFFVPPKFCCFQNNFFKHMIKTKIFSRKKCVLIPPKP